MFKDPSWPLCKEQPGWASEKIALRKFSWLV
jgi:hypothetical protein